MRNIQRWFSKAVMAALVQSLSGLSLVTSANGMPQSGGPTLTISDVSTNEGSSGTTDVFVAVTLSNPNGQTVTVDYQVVDGTAIRGSDYAVISTSGTMTFFNGGATTQRIRVTINGDATNEPDETFFVNFSNATNATLADNQAIGTIINDAGGGGGPTLAIADVNANEGSSGTMDVLVAVTLTNPNGQTVTVDYQVVDGSATRGSDYTVISTAGTMTFFNGGATTQRVRVTINGDVTNEPDETFFVNLSNVTNATLADNQATGTIVNDDGGDPPPVAPGSLTANATGATTIALAWTDNSSDEDGFKIERKTGADAFGEIVTVNSNNTSFNDAGLTACTTYIYRVRAFKGTANSNYSTEASPTTSGCVSPTFAIAEVSASEGNSGTTDVLVAVTLTNPNGQMVTVDYQVVDGTATRGSDYAVISTSGTMTFFNGGATTQRIRVTINGDATDEPDETILVNLSNATNATLTDNQGVATILNDDAVVVTPPNAPSNLTATATGATTIALAWTDNSSDEDGFKIERKISGGNFSEIATPGSNVNSFNDTGLSAGTTYVYRVRAYKSALNSSYSNEVTATTGGGPALAIADVSASEGNSGTTDVLVAVTLTNPNGQMVTVDYQVVDGSAESGSDYTVLSTSGTMTFFNGGATTQRIRVTINGDGTNEPDETVLVNLSNATNATLTDNQGVATIINDDGGDPPPVAPGSLTANATGATTIALAWTDNSSDEDGFKIERKLSGGNFSEIFTTGSNVNSFDDTGLNACTTYIYRVRAFKGTANSNYSNEASPTTSGCVSPTLAIADVSASEGNSGTTDVLVAVTLTNPNGQMVTVDYQVVDGTATRGSDYTVISTFGTMTFFNGGATTQRIRVTINGDATNEPDETVLVNLGNATNATLTDNQGVATILNDDAVVVIPPNAPSNLTATATGATTIALAWTDNSSDEDGFKIERKLSGGNFGEIMTVGGNVTSFNDAGLSAGTTYVYQVRAFNGALNSSYSNEATVTTTTTPPNPPSNLVATATGASTVSLAWTDNSSDESGFKIERKISGGVFSEIISVGSNVNSVNDAGLSAGTVYVYRVRAFKAALNSNYTNEATVTTPPIGTTNLALNKPIAASSTYATRPVTNAVDGSTDTYWRSGTVSNASPPTWLRVDLGAAMVVGRVVVKWRENYYAKNYEAQVSNDDVTWTTVATATGAGGAQTLSFSPRTARYVRLNFLLNQKSNYRIEEFEIYSGAVTKSHEFAAAATSLPEEFVLEQNYPNPFSTRGTSGTPGTRISFSLPSRLAGEHVTIKVYTISGMEVNTLTEANYPAGKHTVVFKPKNLPSGTYFYVMQAGKVRGVRQLMLLK